MLKHKVKDYYNNAYQPWIANFRMDLSVGVLTRILHAITNFDLARLATRSQRQMPYDLDAT